MISTSLTGNQVPKRDMCMSHFSVGRLWGKGSCGMNPHVAVPFEAKEFNRNKIELHYDLLITFSKWKGYKVYKKVI